MVASAIPGAAIEPRNWSYREGQGYSVADGAASAGLEGAGGRAGAGVGAGVGAAEAIGGGVPGRGAAATGFFFAIGFFGFATTCSDTRTGLGASRGAEVAPSASGRTDTVCGW